jgi:DNA invertase Pin-like site-specific DNA recombinase
MKKITGSIRVSSDEQKKKGQMISFYKDDLIKNGVNVNDIIYELGKSGSLDKVEDKEYRIDDDTGIFWVGYKIKKKRPEFWKWMINVSKGNILKHFITKWDRLSRDITFCLNLLDYCDIKNVDVIATSDSSDRRIIPFLIVLAEQEANMTKKRIRDNKQSKFEKGLYIGTQRLNGYKKTKIKIDGREYLHLVPDKDEFQMILDIFSLSDYKTVCDKYKINSTTYYNIKRNKFYCGYVIYKGQEIKGIHTPLISLERWEKYQ